MPKKDGEYEDRGGFWAPVEIWRQEAERWAALYQKGMRVLVSGRMERDDWQGDDETPRTTYIKLQSTHRETPKMTGILTPQT